MTPPFLKNIEELFETLANGTLLVTPNNRLAQQLTQEWAKIYPSPVQEEAGRLRDKIFQFS